MMPPSTKVAPPFSMMPPISRAVAGEIALPSTKAPAKRSPATSLATSTATWGGQIDRITSLARTSAATEPTSSSPPSFARLRVSALRPSPAHSTREPLERTAAPTLLPMSPGFRSPIVVMPLPSLSSRLCEADRAAHLGWPRQRVVRRLDPPEPLENLRGHRRAASRRFGHVQRHQLVGRRQKALRSMIHLMEIVDALRVVREQERREAQRIARPHLTMIGHVCLETNRGDLALLPVRRVETDPTEELVGRVVEDHQVIAHVHVPVVVDPLRPHDVPVTI